MTTSDESAQTMGGWRRRKLWIRPDLQAKVVLGALLVAELTLLVNLLLFFLFASLADRADGTVARVAYESLKASALQAGLVSFVIAAPVAMVVGVYLSFKFCGPIFSIKRFFDQVREGRWDLRCRLREGDDLQDMKDSINAIVGSMTDRLKSSQGVLRDARVALEDMAAAGASSDLDALVGRIRAEESELDQRLGSPSSSANDGGAVEENAELERSAETTTA